VAVNGNDPNTGKSFTAKKLRELLALKNIHNDYELVGDTDGTMPFVMYRNGFKKTNVFSAWQVLVVNQRTDPDGKYRDGFNKTFLVDNDARTSALGYAKQWATEQYGITDWVKTPFGGWTSSAHLDARLRELLPETFDPDYRDPTVQKIVAKLYSDDTSERMFKVQVQLYVKPEPPLYVSATSEDDARRQVTQLFTRVAGTRVLDGLKLHINET
jgi:hypothetical protein